VVERRKAATNSKWLFPADSRSGHIEEPRARAGEFSHPFSPHGLRHTYASVAVVAKVHPFALKLLMNHALPGGDITAGYVRGDFRALLEAQQSITDELKRHGLKG
jgi:integrase